MASYLISVYLSNWWTLPRLPTLAFSFFAYLMYAAALRLISDRTLDLLDFDPAHRYSKFVTTVSISKLNCEFYPPTPTAHLHLPRSAVFPPLSHVLLHRAKMFPQTSSPSAVVGTYAPRCLHVYESLPCHSQLLTSSLPSSRSRYLGLGKVIKGTLYVLPLE